MIEFTEIYLKGDSAVINRILEIARAELGDGIDVIDLHPVIKQFGEDDY